MLLSQLALLPAGAWGRDSEVPSDINYPLILQHPVQEAPGRSPLRETCSPAGHAELASTIGDSILAKNALLNTLFLILTY